MADGRQWPADPQPAVTYSPRGVGRLWESTAGAGRTVLYAHTELGDSLVSGPE